MEDIKTINAAEFLLQSGLLFQINRDILHPLGVALAVNVTDEGSSLSNDLWDYRSDQEGMLYSPETLISGEQKLRKFYAEFGTQKLKDRFDLLGFVTQEITDIDTEMTVEILADFSTALAWLKAGKKVARTDWNQGRYIQFVTPPSSPFTNDGGGSTYEALPYIEMKTEDNKFFPWTITNIDVVCCNWTIIK